MQSTGNNNTDDTDLGTRHGGWLPTMTETVGNETIRAWSAPRRPRPDTAMSVLAVHGLAGTWDSWAGLAGALGAGYDVHALDLPWRAGNADDWARIDRKSVV